MCFLELRQVSKSFSRSNGRHRVLKDINLKIEPGEFVAVLGSSGSGKTTLISLIAGLLEPDAGEILLEGKPITGPGPDRGIVFQNYSLLPWMTVYENVHLAVDTTAPHLSDQEKRARAEAFIRLVKLQDALWKRPGELSGGMRQRVSVARGLAMDPKVLLLDEPFSALDALTRATLQEELARIWMEDRKTVVMITNDVEEAVLLADRIYPLTPGPGATLGPAIPVLLPRPRSRRGLSLDPAYQKVRGAVAGFLTQRRAASDESVWAHGPMGERETPTRPQAHTVSPEATNG
jgi:nitrate/nitrite transport system ATP-binding protein